jgi:predicted small lipoprotein YifL
MRAILALAVAFGLLAACGKKGPPDPPGPPAKIIYPKQYPAK